MNFSVLLYGAAALCGSWFALEARAQVSGSLSLVSDYRFRGISLTEDQPAAQLSLVYDHPAGWYAGIFGLNVKFLYQSDRDVELLSYAGYAHRLPSGASWDAGVEYYAFADNRSFDYPELYCGISSDSLNGRIYYSQDEYGLGANAVYGELNATRPLGERLHLLAHLGILHRLNSGDSKGSLGATRADMLVGLGADVSKVSVQLAWVANKGAEAAYPLRSSGNRNTVLLKFSRPF